jgi:hypothetical protein
MTTREQQMLHTPVSVCQTFGAGNVAQFQDRANDWPLETHNHQTVVAHGLRILRGIGHSTDYRNMSDEKYSVATKAQALAEGDQRVSIGSTIATQVVASERRAADGRIGAKPTPEAKQLTRKRERVATKPFGFRMRDTADDDRDIR